MTIQPKYIQRFVSFYSVDLMDTAATKLLVQCGFYDEAHVESGKAVSTYDLNEDRKLRGYVFPAMDLLEEEIASTLAAQKDNIKETGKYICYLLSVLEPLAYYFYPMTGDTINDDDHFLRALLQEALKSPRKLQSYIPAFLVDRVNMHLANKVAYTGLRPDQRAKEYKLWLKSIEHCLDGHFNKDAVEAFHQLKNGLQVISVIVQSALMENGHKKDLFYYQGTSNVILTEAITIEEISRVRSWTREYSRSISHGYKNIYEMDLLGQRIPVEVGNEYTKWPQLNILEDAVNELFYQVAQGESRCRINWEQVEGSNFNSFQRRITELAHEDPEQYYQALLFAVDRILKQYNFCMELEKHYDERTKDGIICIQAENLLTKYFAAICRQCITMEPKNCAFKLISDLGISLNASWSYLYGQAVKMSDDLSKNLRDRLQVIQCNKCSVRGCTGRFSDVLGVIDFVGPHCDSLIFKNSQNCDGIAPNSNNPDSPQPECSVPKNEPTTNPELLKYLKALQADGYLSPSYSWINAGHTHYHAGWAAKIIISNVEGVHYDDISMIIGVKNLSDNASKCDKQGKISKKNDIENCFSSHGLSTKTI